MFPALKKYFGLDTFRPIQQEVVEYVLANPTSHAFVLIKTGGGKSLCYQLPAVMSKGVTVVISPLISLIEDQVITLKKRSIPAAFYCSSNEQNNPQVIKELADNQLKLLYTTPESLLGAGALADTLADLYEKKLLARFVIDEAHVLSSWGHDFRPNYLALKNLRTLYPETGMTLLTATARQVTQNDIIETLNLSTANLRADPESQIPERSVRVPTLAPENTRDQMKISENAYGSRAVRIFRTSFWRSNLRIHVVAKTPDPIGQIVSIIRTRQQKHGLETGIVYCLSRDDCQRTCHALQGVGIRAQFYHAKIMGVEKTRVLTDWLNGDIQVVVATIAFGLGIDMPSVRYIIHQSMPSSLEGYFQEIGRAGRDGANSIAYLLYNNSDARMLERMRMGDGNNETLIEAVQQFAENRIDCRMRLLVEYLDQSENSEQDCGKCDNCRRPNITSIEVTGVMKYLAHLSGTFSEGGLISQLSHVRELRKWARKDLLRLVRLALSHGVLKMVNPGSGIADSGKFHAESGIVDFGSAIFLRLPVGHMLSPIIAEPLVTTKIVSEINFGIEIHHTSNDTIEFELC
jgi:ATP-dependent DNA helicase RecQ